MKKLKFIGYVVVACALFVGCNDLLEEPSPATSLPGEQVLTTEDGVEGLRASLYSRLRSSFNYSTEYFIGPSAIADETRNRSGSTRFQGLNTLHGQDGGNNGLSSYGTTYNIILDANLMINAVEDDVFEDQAVLERYRGEAYALRAFAMHHLVRALGYEPGMSQGSYEPGFDLGIVIRTEPTLDISDVDERPRATVDEVYSQILSDLAEAKSRLAGQMDNTRITEAFVDGMIARVNLYAGNWSAAETAAQDAINNSGRSLADTEDDVANMFDETAADHPEALFKVVVDPNTEPIGGSNVNNGLAAYTSTVWVAQVPTQKVLDLYEADDYRLGWYAPCFNDRAGNAVTGCDDVNDDGLEIQKWGGEKGQQADDIPYMRLAEMYLIQAEAAAKASGNYEDGLGPLNTLREARGLDPLQPVLDIGSLEELEDEILDERIRELIVEGHRWWDLKRLGRNIPNPDGTTKVRYDSYRILDDIGAGNISANPELVENPGYRE